MGSYSQLAHGWAASHPSIGLPQSRIHQATYGKSLAIMTEAQLSTAVIENPEMLQYQHRQQQLDHKGPAARDAAPAARDTGSAPSVAGVVNGESLEDIRKVRAGPSAPRTLPTAFPERCTQGSGPRALPSGDYQLLVFPWAPCSPGVRVRVGGVGRATTELGAKAIPRCSCRAPPAPGGAHTGCGGSPRL